MVRFDAFSAEQLEAKKTAAESAIAKAEGGIPGRIAVRDDSTRSAGVRLSASRGLRRLKDRVASERGRLSRINRALSQKSRAAAAPTPERARQILRSDKDLEIAQERETREKLRTLLPPKKPEPLKNPIYTFTVDGKTFKTSSAAFVKQKTGIDPHELEENSIALKNRETGRTELFRKEAGLAVRVQQPTKRAETPISVSNAPSVRDGGNTPVPLEVPPQAKEQPFFIASDLVRGDTGGNISVAPPPAVWTPPTTARERALADERLTSRKASAFTAMNLEQGNLGAALYFSNLIVPVATYEFFLGNPVEGAIEGYGSTEGSTPRKNAAALKGFAEGTGENLAGLGLLAGALIEQPGTVWEEVKQNPVGTGTQLVIGASLVAAGVVAGRRSPTPVIESVTQGEQFTFDSVGGYLTKTSESKVTVGRQTYTVTSEQKGNFAVVGKNQGVADPAGLNLMEFTRVESGAGFETPGLIGQERGTLTVTKGGRTVATGELEVRTGAVQTGKAAKLTTNNEIAYTRIAEATVQQPGKKGVQTFTSQEIGGLSQQAEVIFGTKDPNLRFDVTTGKSRVRAGDVVSDKATVIKSATAEGRVGTPVQRINTGFVDPVSGDAIISVELTGGEPRLVARSFFGTSEQTAPTTIGKVAEIPSWAREVAKAQAKQKAISAESSLRIENVRAASEGQPIQSGGSQVSIQKAIPEWELRKIVADIETQTENTLVRYASREQVARADAKTITPLENVMRSTEAESTIIKNIVAQDAKGTTVIVPPTFTTQENISPVTSFATESRSTQKDETRAIPITVTPSKASTQTRPTYEQIPISRTAAASRLGTPSKLSNIERVTSESVQRIEPVIAQVNAQRVNTAAAQKLATPQQLATVQRIGFSPPSPPGGPIATPPLPPPIITASLPEIDLPSRRAQPTRLSVQSRVRGVWANIGQARSKKEAAGIGSKFTLGGAAASFRALDTSGRSVGGLLGFVSKNVFTPSKKDKDVIVQRRSKRIASPGEKQEITMKGILTTRGGGNKWV